MLIACYRKNQIHSQLYVRLTDDESSFSKGCSSACWSSFLSCTTNWDSYISCTMVNNLRMYPKDVKELDLGTWKYRFLPVQLFQYIYIPTFFFRTQYFQDCFWNKSCFITWLSCFVFLCKSWFIWFPFCTEEINVSNSSLFLDEPKNKMLYTITFAHFNWWPCQDAPPDSKSG